MWRVPANGCSATADCGACDAKRSLRPRAPAAARSIRAFGRKCERGRVTSVTMASPSVRSPLMGIAVPSDANATASPAFAAIVGSKTYKRRRVEEGAAGDSSAKAGGTGTAAPAAATPTGASDKGGRTVKYNKRGVSLHVETENASARRSLRCA